MNIDLNQLFFDFLKVLFVLAGVIYLIFSVIVIRQISIMQKSLMTSLAGKIRLMAYLHLGVAVLVLVYFVTAL